MKVTDRSTTFEKNIRNSLKKIIGEVALQSPLDSKIIADLNIASIDLLDFLFDLEKETGINIDLQILFAKYRGTEENSGRLDISLADILSYLDQN